MDIAQSKSITMFSDIEPYIDNTMSIHMHAMLLKSATSSLSKVKATINNNISASITSLDHHLFKLSSHSQNISTTLLDQAKLNSHPIFIEICKQIEDSLKIICTITQKTVETFKDFAM